MKLLDLYCCAGGAGVGYARAGFEVIGVDITDRANYPLRFVQGHAIDFIAQLVASVMQRRPMLIHASPPCQEACAPTLGTNKAKGWGRDHTQLVPQTREVLQRSGLPYVIEQPTSGRKGLIRRDLTLCMDMFPIADPPWVQRHRSFELGGPWPLIMAPPHPRHRGYVRGMRHGVWREGPGAPYVAAYGKGGGKAKVWEMQHAMGIDWTAEHEELTEAIPPAYTEWIGRQFLAGVS